MWSFLILSCNVVSWIFYSNWRQTDNGSLLLIIASQSSPVCYTKISLALLVTWTTAPKKKKKRLYVLFRSRLHMICSRSYEVCYMNCGIWMLLFRAYSFTVLSGTAVEFEAVIKDLGIFRWRQINGRIILLQVFLPYTRSNIILIGGTLW